MTHTTYARALSLSALVVTPKCHIAKTLLNCLHPHSFACVIAYLLIHRYNLSENAKISTKTVFHSIALVRHLFRHPSTHVLMHAHSSTRPARAPGYGNDCVHLHGIMSLDRRVQNVSAYVLVRDGHYQAFFIADESYALIPSSRIN